jgi:hypothetical protein
MIEAIGTDENCSEDKEGMQKLRREVNEMAEYLRKLYVDSIHDLICCHLSAYVNKIQ